MTQTTGGEPVVPKFASTLGNFALAIGAILAILPGPAGALGYRVLYAFNGGSDGARPADGVTLDGAGNIFGTTSEGGGTGCSHHRGCGTVFEIAPDGTETILATFPDMKSGRVPEAPLLIDQNGNVFGTTWKGGKKCNNRFRPGTCGILFKLTSDIGETVLHYFRGSWDGGKPQHAGLLVDDGGNLIGSTPDGGNENAGVIFKFDPAGKETILYSFSYSVGGPVGTLVRDQPGNLYGATVNGALFSFAPDGTYTMLHYFSGSEGRNPRGGLIADNEGNLYGTTYAGGRNGFGCIGGEGCGTVFKLGPDGTLTTLHAFAGQGDGYNPEGSLVADSEGNLYGTAFDQVFELSPNGVITHLAYNTPSPDLVMDEHGNIYGTSEFGGNRTACKDGCGIVFELSQH